MAISFIVLFIWIHPGLCEELAQKSREPAKTAPSEASMVIPLSEVPMQASIVSDKLRTWKTLQTPSPQIEEISKALPQKFAQIDTERASAEVMLRKHPSLSTLQIRQEFWTKIQLEISGWVSLISNRAEALQDALRGLKELRETWSRTRDSLQGSNTHPLIVQQVEFTLAAVVAMERELLRQRDAILDLHARVADEAARCDNVLEEIVEAQRKAVEGIMERGLPIWSPDAWASNPDEIKTRAREAADACVAELVEYVHDPSKNLPFHLLMFFIALPLFLAARRKVRDRLKTGMETPTAALVFERPFASALLVPLVVGTAVYLLPAPPTVRVLFLIFAVVPIIRVVEPVVSSTVIPGLFALGGLFALDTVRQIFDIASSVNGQSFCSRYSAGCLCLANSVFCRAGRNSRPG